LLRLFREYGVELISANDGGVVDMEESMVLYGVMAELVKQGRKRRQ